MPLLNARGSDEAVLRCRPSCDDGGAAAAAWEAAVLSEAGGIAVEFATPIVTPLSTPSRSASDVAASSLQTASHLGEVSTSSMPTQIHLREVSASS